MDEEYGQVPCYSGMAVCIRRLGTQAWILNVLTHRKVIEALKTTITEHKDPVHQLIEKQPIPVNRMIRLPHDHHMNPASPDPGAIVGAYRAMPCYS